MTHIRFFLNFISFLQHGHMISYYGALKLADKDLDLLVRYFHFHNSPAAVPRPCRNDGSSKKQLLKIKGRKIMHSSPLLNPWGKIKRVAFLFVSVFSGLGLSFSLSRALSREGGDTGIYLCFRGRRTVDTPVVVEHTERSPAAVNAWRQAAGKKRKREQSIWGN